MDNYTRTLASLDSVAEVLERRKSPLAVEVDAVAYAVRHIAGQKPNKAAVIDDLAEKFERVGDTKVAAALDVLAHEIHTGGQR